jgi:hypothetical protein
MIINPSLNARGLSLSGLCYISRMHMQGWRTGVLRHSVYSLVCEAERRPLSRGQMQPPSLDQ